MSKGASKRPRGPHLGFPVEACQVQSAVGHRFQQFTLPASTYLRGSVDCVLLSVPYTHACMAASMIRRQLGGRLRTALGWLTVKAGRSMSTEPDKIMKHLLGLATQAAHSE